MNNKNFSINLLYINILEKEINYLDLYKFELLKNKPFWFQKKKLKNYQIKIKKIDNNLDILNRKLLSEYKKIDLL